MKWGTEINARALRCDLKLDVCVYVCTKVGLLLNPLGHLHSYSYVYLDYFLVNFLLWKI